ncbi:FadR/GntR family transcriptional regulator [Arthrobacter sp. VKM Ac-2550]|uniref:FadR/GntR family transcriptional regulator n=1 Tax=Crystallibacter permensis TaxID=1938888 RepID=UPI002225FB56|nr:FCD domain-containing protein [Arthrobacter sp. VKM Ac-2550]MCW2131240.1 transcriptional regulator, GntR family [Arthrobacter sp. VKM Ac-2550]
MSDDTIGLDFFEDQLMSVLARQVLAMNPGEKLPSEREQAQELGVSRTALRDRLGRLESMGVLERRTGAGTFVRGLRPETVSESILLGLVASKMSLASLRSVRCALERQAAYEAAQKVDHIAVAHMAVALDRMDASDDSDELHEADVAFHRALFAASGSRALIFFADVLHGVLAPHQKLSLADDRERLRVVHRDIAEAVSAHDPAMAMKAIDEHFLWLDQLILRSEAPERTVEVPA